MSDGTNLLLAGDFLTAKAMLVLQDRPVVAYGSYLANGLHECAESGRTLLIVTPEESRVTLPLRVILSGQPAKWVVRPTDGSAAYDGLTGAPVQWDGASFVPTPGAPSHASGFLNPPAATIGSQLTLTLRIRYSVNDLLGGTVEHLCLALQGKVPAGYGTFEPSTRLWDRIELTQHCQAHPGPTWLTFAGGTKPAPAEGGPAALLGTIAITPIPGGFEESLTLVTGYPETMAPPIGQLPALAGEIAEQHQLLSCSAQFGPGPVDLTTEPHWVGSQSPLGLAVSAELGGGSAVPPDIPGRQLGSIWWYDLGDGHSPEGWQRYQRLVSHLEPR